MEPWQWLDYVEVIFIYVCMFINPACVYILYPPPSFCFAGCSPKECLIAGPVAGGRASRAARGKPEGGGDTHGQGKDE